MNSHNYNTVIFISASRFAVSPKLRLALCMPFIVSVTLIASHGLPVFFFKTFHFLHPSGVFVVRLWWDLMALLTPSQVPDMLFKSNLVVLKHAAWLGTSSVTTDGLFRLFLSHNAVSCFQHESCEVLVVGIALLTTKRLAHSARSTSISLLVGSIMGPSNERVHLCSVHYSESLALLMWFHDVVKISL